MSRNNKHQWSSVKDLSRLKKNLESRLNTKGCTKDLANSSRAKTTKVTSISHNERLLMKQHNSKLKVSLGLKKKRNEILQTSRPSLT